MQIEKDTVAQFHYTLSEPEGQTIETTQGDEPVVALIGHPGLMPALESALLGKATGDKFSTTLAPDQAYGEAAEPDIHRVPIKYLADQKNLKVGMTTKVNTNQGLRDVTIVKVGRFNVDIDATHPLAGKSLTFDIEVTDVRAATAEELAHGHVHGAGGCHH